MMSEIIEYMEAHAGFIGVVSSLCMLLVTSIYAAITWWQAVNSKKTLLASVKQHREIKQPYIVPVINSVSGCAFDTSSYLRIQFSFYYTLENVGDSSAVTLYTFLYAKLQHQKESQLVYAHLMPSYLNSLRVGQQKDENIHFETKEFRDIIEDLEIRYAKNMKRIETNPSATPYRGPIIILRCLYMNMMGQWFESVLEQELGGVNKKSADNNDNVDTDELVEDRVTNDDIKDGDQFEGWMISPGYSKLSRRMVTPQYVSEVLEECRKFSCSKLKYLEP